jgi:YggT family protein
MGADTVGFGLLAFDAIEAIQNFVHVFALVYVLVIFAYVITSWIRLPYALNPVQRFLYDVCDPYLRIFRRVLPTLGPLDLSPIVAVLVILGLDRLITALLDLAN